MLNGFRQLGDGPGGEVEETELLERLSREVKPAGPSDFMFAVDPVDVSAGVTPDPLSGELQELVASSEGQGLNGANGGAGRFTAFAADDVRTEGALAHARGDRVRVFVFGHLKRAGDHAIAASDTLRYIVEYRSVIPSLKGPYNACGDAGRLEAVHALGLDKDGNGPVSFIKPPGVEPIDHGEFRRLQLTPSIQDERIVKGLGRFGKRVDPIAGLFALPAADTQGEIHEAAEGFLSCRGRVRPTGGRGQKGQSRNCPGCFQKVPAMPIHDSSFDCESVRGCCVLLRVFCSSLGWRPVDKVKRCMEITELF